MTSASQSPLTLLYRRGHGVQGLQQILYVVGDASARFVNGLEVGVLGQLAFTFLGVVKVPDKL